MGKAGQGVGGEDDEGADETVYVRGLEGELKSARGRMERSKQTSSDDLNRPNTRTGSGSACKVKSAAWKLLTLSPILYQSTPALGSTFRPSSTWRGGGGTEGGSERGSA